MAYFGVLEALNLGATGMSSRTRPSRGGNFVVKKQYSIYFRLVCELLQKGN